MKRILLGLVVLAFSSAAHANWVYVKRIDPITDRDTSYAFGKTRNQFLQVGCDGPQRVIFVGTGFHGTKWSPVVYRFDSEPPTEAEVWKADREVTGFWVPESLTEQFLEKTKTASRVVVQAENYNGSHITVIFDLAGSAKAINKLSCVQN